MSRRFVGTLGKPEAAPGGGVRVPARLTRPGVFTYRWPDGRTTRDYRSPEVVTDASCLSTLASAPLTIDHPKANGASIKVTADNWRALSVGHVEAPIVLDDGWVGGSVVVADAATLQAIDRGEILEVSCGFRALYDDTPGVTPEGVAYDRKVLSMEYNHVALLPQGTPARVPGAALCLDADAEVVLEEVEDAAPLEVAAKDAETVSDDPLAGGDSSVKPGDSPVTEGQVATMLAKALAPLNDTIASLTKALAEVAATAAAKPPEPEEPEEDNMQKKQVPPGQEPAEGEEPVEGEATAEGEAPVEAAAAEGEAPVEDPKAKKKPFPVEDSVGLLEQLAAEKARADALEALLVQAQADIVGKVRERRMVEDAAQALGLPVVDDTRELKLAVVRKSLPDFATDSTDLALDAHFAAVHRVSQTQLAARAFGVMGASQTKAPEVEPDAYGTFLENERARGPR